MKKVILVLLVTLFVGSSCSFVLKPRPDIWKVGLMTNGSVVAIGKATEENSDIAEEIADLKAKENALRETLNLLKRDPNDHYKYGSEGIEITARRIRGNTCESRAEVPHWKVREIMYN